MVINWTYTERNWSSDEVNQVMQRWLHYLNDFVPGREHVIFLGPDYDLSTEVWRFFFYWDVVRGEDGTVFAIHPHRDLWALSKPAGYQTHQSVLEMELPAFTEAVAAGHKARMAKYGGRIGADESLPMLVTDANDLRDYYVEVGAYDDQDNPPAQPPPP